MSTPLKIITTEDGSHSLYNADLNETYHSFHGAVQESRHVFIKAGLDYIKATGTNAIHLFEVGLGTGLNALLTAEWADSNNTFVYMTSIEAFPVSEDIVRQLNYTDLINNELANGWFNAIHASNWGESTQINNHFYLKKIHGNLENYEIDIEKYHVIFFDAFAPSKQQEMWSENILKCTIDGLQKAGCFVTYCAQGQLKRTLRSLGMEVETLAGPPGKKEMVRAIRE